MTAEENILMNAEAMRGAGVPEMFILHHMEKAVQHAAQLSK
jgi:hypothetical protein